jgi:hypothetical protein
LLYSCEGSSPGPHNICYEMLKQLPETFGSTKKILMIGQKRL